MSTNDRNDSKSFASDNWAGILPEALAAIAEANVGHVEAYGGDPWTAHFQDCMRELFGDTAEAFPVFNGTGANVLALQAAIPRWGAVICAADSHVNVDETGAPEKTGGLKLLGVETVDGKLTPALVAREAWGWGTPHRAQPLALSVAQPTELGTCYTVAELRALADFAHARGMVFHIDGSRLSNAAAHLGVSLREITTEIGADLLSLGGTKSGLFAAEAVIAIRPGSTPGISYLRKICLQLNSKMRFASAQLLALYADTLWQRTAQHTNGLASRLGKEVTKLASEYPASGIRIAYPVASNAVFVKLPKAIAEVAQASFAFGSWPGSPGLYRLMCAFDTTQGDVDTLVSVLRQATVEWSTTGPGE